MDEAYYKRMEAFRPRFEDVLQRLDAGEGPDALVSLRALAEDGFAPALFSLAWNAADDSDQAAWIAELERRATGPDPLAKYFMCMAYDFCPNRLDFETTNAKKRKYLEEAVSLGYGHAQDWLDELVRMEFRQQRPSSPYELECFDNDPTKPERFVHAYYDGACYMFAHQVEISESASTFGGEHGYQFAGILHGPAPLQQVVRLSQKDFGWSDPEDMPLPELPMLFGFSYDGSYVEYTVSNDRTLTVERMHPTESLPSRPYENFPTSFPAIALTLVERRPMSYEEFSDGWWNTPKTPPDILVMVPPPRRLDFSIWDAEAVNAGVVVVFECHLRERRICAYSVCD
ncbi:hypothetical protein [Cupriavidus agavae]|uniref:Uncharacterized protein n=1 Tax=Cupriavidus agavae TaxID=1001822 RepID=A0A4Q7R8B6_9BURK|nr:hypothetical protein [Cupriavidus agavae]RZT29093.1 hypothetical protein EV147_5055 [Cupriavidus agavae]